MTSQRLLYLSPHQMTAYRWQSGVLAYEETFSPSDAGLQQFNRYLAQNLQSTFSLLANVAEEGFQIETIPYLQGADRRKIIERKLDQAFFNTPLSTALSLGHEKSRRKDERLLLAALTNPAAFQPWLDILREAQVALAGIYSIPLLAPLLFKKLRLAQEPCLLLTVQDQSVRQSYFEKGELHFSRLTSLQHSSIGSIAQTFATESLKLQQYLSSQRLIGRSQAITAHILAHPGAFKSIRTSCIDTPTVHFNILDITECAERTGLKTVPQDTHSESLFLHLLMINRPAVQFAGEDLRHNFRISQIRSLLQGIGAMALIGCLLLSGKLLFDTHEIRQNTEALRNEATLARQRYGDIVSTFPQVPADNDTLKNAIDRYLAQERRSTTPIGLYRELSRALNSEPAIELDRLDWKIGGTESNAGTASQQEADSKPVPEDSESLVVQGSLRLGDNPEARQLLSTFNRFVTVLRANPALQVEILQQPFDIESGKPLRSGDPSSEGNPPRKFSLQIIRKIES